MRVHTLQRPSVFDQKRSGTVESPSIFAKFKLPPPKDYFTFPKLKLELKGDHYALIEDIQEAIIKVFPISDSARAMKQLEDHT